MPIRAAVTLAVLAAWWLPAHAQGGGAVFEPGPCPVAVSQRLGPLECGHVPVPELRGDPRSGTLRLAVVVVRALEPRADASPIIFIEGGPGLGSLDFVPSRVASPRWASLRARRDVVFYDQRGTGFSGPFWCPDVQRQRVALALGPQPPDATTRDAGLIAECRRWLAARGIDPEGYDTAANVQDLDDIRRALGYDRVNLMAHSYGTYLALQAMRSIPQFIHSVVLDSVMPVHVSPWVDLPGFFKRALDAVFETCAGDPPCSDAFPTSSADFVAALQALDRTPLVVDFPAGGRLPERMVVDGDTAIAGLRRMLYEPERAVVIPWLAHGLRMDRREPLTAIVRNVLNNQSSIFSRALVEAIFCQDVAPFQDRDEVGAAERAVPGLTGWRVKVGLYDECDAWGLKPSAPDQHEAVSSDIPTLLLAGDRDPITPPAYARAAAEGLSQSQVVVVHGAGHGVGPANACTASLAQTFFDASSRPIEIGCETAVAPPRFVTGVSAQPGIQRLAAAVRTRRVASLLAPALILAPVALWPIFAMPLRRLRRAPRRLQAPAARSASTMAAVTLLFFAVGCGLAFVSTARVTPLILNVGVLPAWRPVFWLPAVAMAFSLLALIRLVRQRGGPGPRRLGVEVVIVASQLALGGVLLAAGFFTP